MCNKKVIETETKAIQVKKKMEQNRFNLFRHYYCSECKGWHIAHAIPRKKMKILMDKMGMEYTQ